MSLESIESKNLSVADIINETKKESNNLREKISYELPEQIWWYKIMDSYAGFLRKNEKWFAIELSDWENYTPCLAIIVKYVNWKIEIRDTQQEPYSDDEYSMITLEPDEQSLNEDVNKINKYIKDLWFSTLTNSTWDLNKLAAAIEFVSK